MNHSKKRLCIYLTYDKQQRVDSYIGYMLKELKTCVDYLVVVCNEMKILSGREILEKYADEIFCRENLGFDVGGFKDALCKFIGWDKVLQYDELILANDSFFGPFCPMKRIFEQMGGKKIDFWGLTKHGKRKISSRSFSEHIQSFFIGIRKRMLHCIQFREYWEEMPVYQTFEDVICQYEEKFTSYFANLGYTYDVLADNDVNDTTINMYGNYSQYAHISYELIRKRNFPFLKKQQISYDTLFDQTQENLRQSIDYIDKETDYDVDLIWENLIRTMNMTDLQRSLHLQYLIPSGTLTSSDQRYDVYGKTALVVFAAYPNSAEYVLEYLVRLPSDISVFIYAEKQENLNDYQDQGWKCTVTSSDHTMELLSKFCEYDYVGVLHDTDLSSDEKPNCVGKSWFYHIWENLVKDSGHISGILEQFAKEPRLGFLAPPQPNFAEYFGAYGRGWNGAYEDVFRIVERLQLQCQISVQLPPFRITDNFWIRGCVLQKLRNLLPEEYGYFPYLPIFLAQDAGYYSGIVESTAYASMNEVNMQYYLTQLGSFVKEWYGEFGTFQEMKKHLCISALRYFCGKYDEILIYGAGGLAREYGAFVPEAKAYLVSDGQKKPEKMEGKPVKYLSQVIPSEKCAIVIFLNKENQAEVIPLLEKRGFKHYFAL